MLFPAQVCKNRNFIYGSLIGTVFFVGQSGFFLTFTLYLQQGLAMSALFAGLMQVPVAAAAAVGSACSGRLVGRYGRALLIFGQLGIAVGVAVFLCAISLVTGYWTIILLIIGALCFGFSRGFVISPNQLLSLLQIPGASSATAAALLQTVRRIGGSVGIAMMSMVFFIN